MKFVFKPLEIQQEPNPLKRFYKSAHVRKTVLYMAVGALLSFALFYFSEGMHMKIMPNKEIIRSIFVGAFVGFFLTNSPCARGKC